MSDVMPDHLTIRKHLQMAEMHSTSYHASEHIRAALAALDQAPSVLPGTDEQMRVINDPVRVPATRDEEKPHPAQVVPPTTASLIGGVDAVKRQDTCRGTGRAS